MDTKKNPKPGVCNGIISSEIPQDTTNLQADNHDIQEQDLLELMLYPDSPRTSER